MNRGGRKGVVEADPKDVRRRAAARASREGPAHARKRGRGTRDGHEQFELVQEALGGSQRAYRELVHRFERPVFNLVARMVRDRTLAEDLTQDAFVKAFGRLDSYQPAQGKFSNWLFKIAHNTAIDHLRRSALDVVPLDSGEPEHADLHAILSDPDIGLWQSLYDLVELLRRKRKRPALGDGGLAPASQRNLEIGCEHPHLIALRLDQDIGEDGDGVLPLDDALEKL